MAIITKGSNLEKGNEVEFTLNITDLLAHASVSGDAYFSDQSNWDKVFINYTSEGYQKEILIFKNVDSGTSSAANFGVFSDARDLFEVQSIIIMDKQGGYLCIKRSDLVVADFDVDFSVAAIRAANFSNTELMEASSFLNGSDTISRLAFFSWIYVDDIGGADQIHEIFYMHSNTGTKVVDMFTDGSNLTLKIGISDIVSTPMIYNQWVLVGFNYIGGVGGQAVHLILNGTSVQMPTSVPTSLYNSGNLPLYFSSNASSYRFNGKVSTTGLYVNNYSMLDNHITSLYHIGHNQDPNSVIGQEPTHLYLFDDNQGDTPTTITDQRGSNDLTVSPAISFSDYDGE